MAKLAMNSSDLLASIKSRALVPTSQITFSDEDLLNFATEEVSLKLVPSILAVREEFYVTEEVQNLVDNQSNYKIPYRSIGNRVRFVYINQSGTQAQPLAQLPIEDIIEYQEDNFSYQNAGFYLQNDEIVIMPPITASANGTIVFKYYLKPNAVVLLSRGAKITAINTTTGEISVETVPSNISVNSEVDFIGSTGNFKTKAFDIIASGVSSISKIIMVSPGDIPTNLSVGDYICTAGETVIPQVPAELQVMLAQAVACRVLEALDDTVGLQNANAKLAEMEAKLLNVISSRIEAPGRKITNRNSFLRNRRYNRQRY
jgi:hypothetical protein